MMQGLVNSTFQLCKAAKPLFPEAMWKYTRTKAWRMYEDFFDPYRQISYSQEGEDLILDRCFGTKKNGFYVDVGAFHPKKFSNTFLFYQKGWNGVNIDATPGCMMEFKRVRPRDINLEVAVSDRDEDVVLSEYSNPVFNTLSQEQIETYQGRDLRFVRFSSVKAKRLDQILDNLKINRPIDFFSIDVEGYDLKVLRSNNWTQFRPFYVCVEERQSSLLSYDSSPIGIFLRDRGYSIFAKTFQSLFFRDDEVGSGARSRCESARSVA